MSRKPMSDVIVLLPGILGSVLQKNNKDVWGLSGGAFSRALWSLGGNIKDLAIPEQHIDRDDYDDGVTAPRLMADTHLIPYFWKVDGYSLIAETIKRDFAVEEGRNYFEFPYDWRRDNRIAARKLQRLSSEWLTNWRNSTNNQDAKLILIGHSMGGLVSRYFLEVLDGWRDTRMLLTFGTPYRGSLNALNFLSNGFTRGVGPLKVDLSAMLRSFPSVYQLLPIYRCYDQGDGALVRLTEAASVPGVNPARLANARAFHREIEEAVDKHLNDDAYMRDRYRIHPVVGTYQPTLQSAVWTGQTVELSQDYEGKDLGGDGTVPRVSATPIELSDAHAEVFAAEQHGSLQNAQSVLTQVGGLLSGLDLKLANFRALPSRIGVDVEDAFEVAEPINVRARSDSAANLDAILTNTETNAEVGRGRFRKGMGEWQTIEFPPQPEGIYRVTVADESQQAEPVSDIFAVLGT
jgi:hypothetical protein